MTDFTPDGQPFEMPLNAANQQYANTAPTLNTAFGALRDEFSSGSAIQRWMQRAPYEDTLLGKVGRAIIAGGESIGGQVPTSDPSLAPTPAPMLEPEEANKTYAPEGVKLFTAPVTEPVAQMIGKAKADEIQREDILRRFSNSYSWPTRLATSAAAFMMDPLNAATTFLPGIGEETILARLGEGVAARTLARAGAGATAAAAGMAPVVALKYGLGQEEQSDYDLRSAFYDMMFAAAGGAAIHAGMGALREAGILKPDITMLPDAPTNADAMKAAVSQVVDGKPVDVEPVLNGDATPHVAEAQRTLYRDGYANGVPQGDLNAAQSEIYAPKPEEVKPPQVVEQNTELANAEASLAQSGEIHPQDAAELQRTEQAMNDANLKEQAYNQAAQCIAEGGMT